MKPSFRALPPDWQSALIGVLASVPIAVILDRLPGVEAPIAGYIMGTGAFFAGTAATIRSENPGAAGLRVGLLGGALAVLTPVVTNSSAGIRTPLVAWSLSRVVFLLFGSVFVLFSCLIFGQWFGYVGGWVTNSLATCRSTGSDAS